MRIPGVTGGRVLEPWGQNLDVTPTILDYLGLDPERFAFEGRSLRRLVEASRPVHPHVFASQGKHRIVNDGAYKLIYDLRSERSRLFHLATDPGEHTDLADRRLPDLRLDRALARRDQLRARGAGRQQAGGDQERRKRGAASPRDHRGELEAAQARHLSVGVI